MASSTGVLFPTAPLASDSCPPPYSVNPLSPPPYISKRDDCSPPLYMESSDSPGAVEDESLFGSVSSPRLPETKETQSSRFDKLSRPLRDCFASIISLFCTACAFMKLSVVLLWKSRFCCVDNKEYLTLTSTQVRDHIQHAQICLQDSAVEQETLDQNNYLIAKCAQCLCDPLTDLCSTDRIEYFGKLTSFIEGLSKNDALKGCRDQLIRILMQISWTEIGEEGSKFRAKVFGYSEHVPDSSRGSYTGAEMYFTSRFSKIIAPANRQLLFELLWTHEKGSFSSKEKQWMKSIPVGEWILLVEEAKTLRCPPKFMRNISSVLEEMNWTSEAVASWVGQVSNSKDLVLQSLFALSKKAQNAVIPKLAEDIMFWNEEGRDGLCKRLRIALSVPLQPDHLQRQTLTKWALRGACLAHATQSSFLVR